MNVLKKTQGNRRGRVFPSCVYTQHMKKVDLRVDLKRGPEVRGITISNWKRIPFLVSVFIKSLVEIL